MPSNNFTVKPVQQIKYDDSVPTIKQATVPKAPKLTKAEKAEQQRLATTAHLADLNEAANNLFVNNKEYQNGSLEYKNEMIDHYLNTTWKNFLANNPAYQNDPELALEADRTVRSVLTAEKNKNNQYFKDYSTWQESISKGMDDARFQAQLLKTGANKAGNQANTQETNLAIDRENKAYEQQRNQLLTQQQEYQDDPIVSQQIEKQLDDLDKRHEDTVFNLNKSRSVAQRQDLREEVENARTLMAIAKENYANEQQRIAENPAYANLRKRPQELKERYGDDSWGITDNNHKFMTVMDWILTNTPQLAVSAGATLAGSALGGTTGASMVMGLSGALQAIGGVGQQIFDDIINASDEDLNKSEDYIKLLNDLSTKYPDEKERRDMAKMYLALGAIEDLAPKTAAIGAALNQFGFEAAVAKTGLASRLAGKGILNRLKRGGASFLESGVSGATEEVVEGAEGIYATNKALNQDRDLLEGWRQNALAGAFAEGTLGGAAGTIRGGAETTPEAAKGDKVTGTAQGRTAAQSTSSSVGSGPAVDEEIRAKTLSTDNPFYRPDDIKSTREELTANKVFDSLVDAGHNIEQTVRGFNKDSEIVLDDNDIISLGSNLTKIVNSDMPNNMEYVRTFINELNKATDNRLDLNLDKILNMSVDALARVAQQTQPNAQTTTQNGGVANGTIQGTNQGAAAANSQAANSQQTTTGTAGQQNITTDTGSSAAAQSTGVGGTTRPDTGETVTAVFPNQPASWHQGQGTYGGRDNTVNGTAGTQSDIGTGSPAGTAEQRTGNDGRSESNGTTEQTWTAVEPEVEQGEYTGSEDIAENIDVTDELFLGVKSYVQETVNDDLRRQVLDTQYSVEYEVEQDRVRNMIRRALPGADARVINANTQLYMRMSLALSNILNRSIGRILPVKSITAHKLEPDSVLAGGYHHINKTIDLYFGSAEDVSTTTLGHELVHAFINAILNNQTALVQEIINGNKSALQFVKDFKEFARRCGIPEGQEFSRDAWDANNARAQERAAVAMEHFMTQPPVNEATRSTGINLLNAETEEERAARIAEMNFCQMIAEFIRSTLRTARAYLSALSINYRRIRNGEKPISFAELVNRLDFRGPIKLDWTLHDAVAGLGDSDLFNYASPHWEFFNYGIPEELDKFFNRIADGYADGSINEPDANAADRPGDFLYAGITADNTLTQLELDNAYMNAGFAPTDAAAMSTMDVAEFNYLKSHMSEVTGSVENLAREAVENGIAEHENLIVDSTSLWGGSEFTTALMTDDNEMYQIMSGKLPPAYTMSGELSSPSAEVGNTSSNPSNVDGAQTEQAEIIVRYKYADQIVREIEGGVLDANAEAAATGMSAVKRSWINYFGNQDIISNPDGSPKELYRRGHTLSEEPTGADLEVSTYARTEFPLDKELNLNDYELHPLYQPTMTDEHKAELQQIINKLRTRIKKAIDAGKDIRLSKKETDALAEIGSAYNQWFDAMVFDDKGVAKYYIFDLQNTADSFTAPKETVYHSIRARKQHENERKQDFEPQPQTQAEVEDILADIINERQQVNNEAARVNTQTSTLDQAELSRTSMTGPARANWWMQFATRVRKKFVDANASFRLWCITNFAPIIGAVDSSSIYQSFVMARNRVRGARTELHEKILYPFNQWVSVMAQQLGVEPADLAKTFGTLYTDLHTIESARRQEQELQDALLRAQMSLDENRQDLIDEAQKNLDDYYERQDQSPEDNNGFRIYGGKTVKDARAEIERIIKGYTKENGEFVPGIGDDLAQQAVGRFQRAYGDLVQLLIERGVLSERDVESFGQWAYYCPLVTQTNYTNTTVNDVISLFPSKLNYHRGGSNTPAVDAFTALEYMTHRSANAMGSVDLGRETIAAYQYLQNLYRENAPEGNAGRNGTFGGVTQKYVFIGRGLGFSYYNGMGVIPLRELESLANSDNAGAEMRQRAREYLDKKDLVVRVQQRIARPDGNGNMSEAYESVPYAVIFDDSTSEMKEVKKAFADPFHIEIDDNGDKKWVKGMSKVTSAFAQMNTTYRPWFPPINAWRDMLERVFYSTGKTYRDDEGNAISGATIARKMTLNSAYAPDIMKAIFTGKPGQIEGKVGQYLQEFKRQGIMTSASIRAMLNHASDDMYVYIQKAVSDLEHGASITETAKKFAAVTKTPFRVWAEMCYAVPTFTMYMALRDSNVSENSAAFYTTEVMNLSQRGTATKKLAPFFPFLASIGQTSAQLTNFFGLNINTFGTIKKPNNEQMQNLARAWLMTGGTMALTYAVLPAIATGLGDGDDDKGYQWLDSQSLGSFNYLPFPIGDGDFLKVQGGFGPTIFAIQAAIGFDRISRGSDTLGNVAFNLMDSFYRNVTPLAGPDFEARGAEEFVSKLIQTIMPSVIAPVTNVAVFNRTYFGNTITQDKYLDATDRRSDIDRDTTESFYKAAAKALYDMPFIGTDVSPEALKEVVKGYTPGILAGIRQWVTDDPLVKDPAFKSVADELGPFYTALGGSMGYGSVGNTEQHLYYAYERMYDRLIQDSGLSDQLKLPDSLRNKVPASQYRTSVLLKAGVDPRIVEDYGAIYELGQTLKNRTKFYHAQLKNAHLRNVPAEGIQEIYNNMRSDRTARISRVLSTLNIHNGNLLRSEIALPDREILDLYRGN